MQSCQGKQQNNGTKSNLTKIKFLCNYVNALGPKIKVKYKHKPTEETEVCEQRVGTASLGNSGSTKLLLQLLEITTNTKQTGPNVGFPSRSTSPQRDPCLSLE